MCDCRCRVQSQEEEVLHDDRGARDEGCGERWVLFEAGPGQINIEKEKKNAQAND